MAKSIYFECSRGISGDMAVAAMIDAGADKDALMSVLKTIPADGFKAEIHRVSKNGIDCCDFAVILDENHENHDHDMEYLYGGHGEKHHARNEKSHSHKDGNEDEEELSPFMHSIISHVEEHIKSVHKQNHGDHHHAHSKEDNGGMTAHHGHDEGHHEHGHHHEHRNLHDVLSIIDKTEMSGGAKTLARRIFDIIAEAEAKAHAVPKEEVHFHEAGAIDSIVDVIALAVCYDNLSSKYGIKKAYIPYIAEGTGTVRCQHGVLPVPVPAVVNIAETHGLPLGIINAQGELATPTGMAFAAALCPKTELPAAFRIISAGTGAGKRAYSVPSIMRAMIIEPQKHDSSACVEHNCGGIYKLETNIDDCTAEALGFAMEQLFENGAKDVYFTPCYMKKCRPAYILSVICTSEKIAKMEEIIFAHTSTIGIRRIKIDRTELPRETITLESPYGKFSAKKAVYGEIVKISPEYEDAAKISRRTGNPFSLVYAELQEICLGAKNGKN
ncbi:MAG: nickel pincer cofactor biosynthesis protein LarC [Elusimicrobiales bacterium]|nr:nickel pincer cofactor biosynthesis protein LarC [Elusimicrobiales bacterium]